MGCRQTKSDKDGKDQRDSDRKCGRTVNNGKGGGGGGDGGGGGELSSAPTSKTCEKLGISARDLFRLQKNWKGIKRNIEATGVEMFVRLFKTNGDLKYMFHDFKDLKSDDEMRSNEALENHATLVMTTLDDAITHIDNYDYVTEILRKTGASHVRFDGFSSDNFWLLLLNIREPFLEAVKLTLQERYSDNMETIYQVAINFILRCMTEGMEEGMRTKAQDNS